MNILEHMTALMIQRAERSGDGELVKLAKDVQTVAMKYAGDTALDDRQLNDINQYWLNKSQSWAEPMPVPQWKGWRRTKPVQWSTICRSHLISGLMPGQTYGHFDLNKIINDRVKEGKVVKFKDGSKVFYRLPDPSQD